MAHSEIVRLARMMRTPETVLLEIERKMNTLTGQSGVLEDIVRTNDITVDQTLAGLGLTKHDGPDVVRQALVARVGNFDRHLFELLDRPNLEDTSAAREKICTTALRIFTPPKGMFLKHDRMLALLEHYPPHTLMEHFGYTTVRELCDREGLSSVMAALRFTQTTQWMHEFFRTSYSAVAPDDFEERDIELLVLDPKWSPIAEKFLEKKYHNVSHLKELGIIFVVSVSLQTSGETLRLFSLLLHYLHEVPFYAGLIRRFLEQPEFNKNFISLLRGDVPSEPLPDGTHTVWRVVQRYLAKENPDDFRLFEPHVSPEANCWWHAEEDLGRLSRVLGRDHGGLDLGWWNGLDFVGELFDGTTRQPELVSFDLVDVLMGLVEHDHGRFLYHQQEALWNKIFVEYMGRDRMEELMQDHIIDGFISL